MVWLRSLLIGGVRRSGFDAIVAQGAGKNVQATIILRGSQAENMRHPRVQIYVLERRDSFTGDDVGAGGKKLAFICGMVRGSKPWAPRAGAASGLSGGGS